MTYPPGPTLWVSGQRLDAADLNDWMQNLPWGLVGSASITSNSSAFTTLADISGLSVAFTAVAGRLYVASFSGITMSTVAADRISITIAEGDNTQLMVGTVQISNGNVPWSVGFETPSHNAGAGSQTYKVRATRVTGTGSCTIQASATSPAVLTVYDVGPV